MTDCFYYFFNPCLSPLSNFGGIFFLLIFKRSLYIVDFNSLPSQCSLFCLLILFLYFLNYELLNFYVALYDFVFWQNHDWTQFSLVFFFFSTLANLLVVSRIDFVHIHIGVEKISKPINSIELYRLLFGELISESCPSLNSLIIELIYFGIWKNSILDNPSESRWIKTNCSLLSVLDFPTKWNF